MTQQLEALVEGQWFSLSLPAPETEAYDRIPWGKAEELFTPAYWKLQSWIRDINANHIESRLGLTLAEEVVACILGGYGIPAELGLAAFKTLQESDLIRWPCNESDIYKALSQPMQVGSWTRKYRFARTKSGYVHAALRETLAQPMLEYRDAKELRDYLLGVPGIGLKTASWIVRNWMGADDVAILDIHIMRACQHCGLFDADVKLPRDYSRLERRFVEFASAIGVKTSRLDAIMWLQVRELPASVRPRPKRGCPSTHEHGCAPKALKPRVSRRPQHAE